MIMIETLGAEIAQRCDTVGAIAGGSSKLAGFARDIAAQIAQPQATTDAIVLLQQMQRLYLLQAAGRLDCAAIADALCGGRFACWDQYHALPASAQEHAMLARCLFEGDPEQRAPVLLILSDYGRYAGEKLVELCVEQHIETDIWVEDNLFHRHLMAQLDVASATHYAEAKSRRRIAAKRVVSIQSNTSLDGVDVPPVDEAVANAYAEVMAARKREMPRFFTITTVPTPTDAQRDDMDFDTYARLFFAMCAVDWQQIDAAQRVLIEKLDAGSHLHITNSDGTDLRMNIGGMTFVNSLIAKNVPGSEVYSAPRRDSVKGTIVAKGRFLPKGASDVVEDITLEFVAGRLVRYDAASGLQTLQTVIESDEGAHWVGEIGIGTNPALRQHVINSLMVEKIGGSFHIALGNAYQFDDYLGTPVAVDNGNRSHLHWDITTMLLGKAGRMVLDGETIMDDGRFVDPRLAYLNGDG